MGLDMSLHGRRFISSYNDVDVAIRDGVEESLASVKENLPKNARINYIQAEFIYWRKANAIHKWFVENVQDDQDDCGEYPVSWEQLKELRDTCALVIANPELASELLPTAEGFFFGETDYDEYYMADLEYTQSIINNLLNWHAMEKLASREWQWDLLYSSSW